jgi:hypothetical protein
MVHLSADARAAGVSLHVARQLAAAGKVPTLKIESGGKRTHVFTSPGSVRAAINAELRRNRLIG